MKIDIDVLSEDELVELNHRVVERLKFLERMHAHNEMMQFAVGQKVSEHRVILVIPNVTKSSILRPSKSLRASE